MFTVKVEYHKGGHQFWETDHVYVFDAPDGKPATHRTVRFQALCGPNIDLTHGRVFIMNENGKTVQQYYLECDPLPEGVDMPPVAEAA